MPGSVMNLERIVRQGVIYPGIIALRFTHPFYS